MTLRPTPDPELVPLVRAIKARIEGLGETTCTPKDGVDVYHRDKTPFLQLELKRDHMSLDVWLTGEQLDEARASGIARAHPFLGDTAVKVRFERAEDLSRVARWIEASYEYAVERAKGPPVGVVEKDTPLISMPPTPSRPSAPAPETPSSIPGPAASAGAAAASSAGAAKAAAPEAKKAAPASKGKAASKKVAVKKTAAKVKAPKAPKAAKKAARGSASADRGSKPKSAAPAKAKKKAVAAKTKAKAAKARPKKKR